MNFRVPGEYSRTPVARTLKGNKKQFESEGTRILRVNFSEILIKGKKIQFELAGNSSYPSSSYRGSIVELILKVDWYQMKAIEVTKLSI